MRVRHQFSSNLNIKIMPQIRLIGVGCKVAKPAGEIKVGDVLIWNYGITSTVLEVVKETRTQIVVMTKNNESGARMLRRMAKKRLVAYDDKKGGAQCL